MMRSIATAPLFTLALVGLTSTTPAEGKDRPRPVRESKPSATIAAANRTGTKEPTPPAFINASAVMPFTEGTIYHVYTVPEQVTDIVLQPGEVLGAVASGDTARWVIGDTTSGSGPAKQSHVLVKPYAAGLATNLIITTDRRTYRLSLSSGTKSGMFSLAWTYPSDALLALKAAEAAADAAAPVAAGLSIEALRFGYAITGDRPAWRPLRVFDDGRQTFIEFPLALAVGEAPPLFVIGDAGAAELVNYRVRGRYYVVDRLFEVAELRLGAKRQDIVRITRGAGRAKARGKRGAA